MNNKKKKKPYAGVLVSQMLAAREAEKNRINENRINEVGLPHSRHAFLAVRFPPGRAILKITEFRPR